VGSDDVGPREYQRAASVGVNAVAARSAMSCILMSLLDAAALLGAVDPGIYPVEAGCLVMRSWARLDQRCIYIDIVM
jgi:hypothetical protein